MSDLEQAVKICVIDGCDHPRKSQTNIRGSSHNMCIMHYYRWKRRGTPYIIPWLVAVKHGKRHTTEYRSWAGMHARCNNPNVSQYKNYGGRGIRVCERWKSFVLFLEDVGKKPAAGMQLDRIDNDGNYEPSNCRWATPKENSNNRRNSVKNRKTICEYCKSEYPYKYKRTRFCGLSCSAKYRVSMRLKIEQIKKGERG